MRVSPKRVLVALSGGVDSAVAAACLLEAGYEVHAVFLCFQAAHDESEAPAARSCCSPADAQDARRVAALLGIPLQVLAAGETMDSLIAETVAEYARGRTPNPCVLCNARLKFGRLLDVADAMGAGFVATGHYAQLMRQGDDRWIARARHRAKDQSYVLFALAPRVLDRLLFPLGDMANKGTVRALARERGLPVHNKPDSQEICFAPPGGMAALVGRAAPEALREGDIVALDGRVLGRHAGIGRYTVGQRRGLKLSAEQPLYVVGIDAAAATVTVGPREALAAWGLRASRAVWHAAPPAREFDATVQIRYNHRGAGARVTLDGEDGFRVRFAEPVEAVAPGQAAVVYLGDRLLGGGWIDESDTRNAEELP